MNCTLNAPLPLAVGYCYLKFKKAPMFDTLFDELNDMPGEIFDVIEFKEEWEKEDKFDVEKHINGDIEF